jgi:hypothetical protein
VQDDGAAFIEADDLPGTERLLQRWFDAPDAEREADASAGGRMFHKTLRNRPRGSVPAQDPQRCLKTNRCGSTWSWAIKSRFHLFAAAA